MRIARIISAVCSLMAVVCWPSFARADTPAPAPSSDNAAEHAAAAAAEAKDLNKKGIAMLDAGDLERALDYFVRSRLALPTTKNTTNAAIALDRLGRYDEALELYEELLLKYAGGLDDEDRAAIAPAMEALRQKVGSISVTSNVGGEVSIDGRFRGKLPLPVPIRVLAGAHKIRVVRVGYQPFERSISVDATKSMSVDARLESQKGVGTLEVEDTDDTHADVFVDGAKLGRAPWEGSLPPGKHLVWLADAHDRGSMPTWVQVIEGQTGLIRLQARPLAPILTLRVEPRTAAIEVGGLSLGSGTWQGRLPAGSYEVAAAERGYHSVNRHLDLRPGTTPIEITLQLKVDPDDPRWPKRRGSAIVDVFGGGMVGPSLGGGNVDHCPDDCKSSSVAFGFLVGARGGFRFPVGAAVEVTAGYMSLRQKVQRSEHDVFGDERTSVTYDLEDKTHVHGPFFGIGGSWRAPIGRFLFAGTRATVGVFVASASDPITGQAKTTGESVPVFVEHNDRTALSAAPYVAPELFGGVHAGPIDVGLSFSAWFLPASGPTLDRGRFGVRGKPGVTDPTAVDNAPESSVVDDERAFGRFVIFSPAVVVGTTF